MTDEFDPRHTRSGDSRESASSRGSRERSSRHRHRHRHDRKERVLHTRISEPLAEDIRRVAEDLRVPVSNLVRNVLEEAFAVVETVSENVGDLIEDIVEEADRTRERIRRHSERTRRHSEESRWQSNGAGRQSEPTRRADTRPEPTAEAAAPRAEYPEVLGWQPLVFNRPQTCSDCEEPIERGERGYVGMVATGLSDIHLCRDCVDARH